MQSVQRLSEHTEQHQQMILLLPALWIGLQIEGWLTLSFLSRHLQKVGRVDVDVQGMCVNVDV